MDSGDGGDGGVVVRTEFWKKRAKAAFEASFKHPKMKNTMYTSVRNIPKEFRWNRMMNAQEFELYTKKCRESEGFDVSGCTGGLCGGIVEIKKSHTRSMEDARRFAQFAVDKHNSDHGGELEYVEVVKANAQGVRGIIYYITLKAIDKKVDQVKVYRAKVWDGCRDEIELIFLKDAPESEEQITPQPVQELAPKKKLKKKKTAKSRRIAPNPFFAFVKHLKSMPILADRKHSQVVAIASDIWHKVQDDEKCHYMRTGKFLFEDQLLDEVQFLLTHRRDFWKD